MDQLHSVWQMKPVQQGLKSFAAGTAVCAAMWATTSISKYFSQSDIDRQEAIKKLFPTRLTIYLNNIQETAPELLDLLGRLEPFRRFDPPAFDKIIEAMASAHVRSVKSATDSYRVRAEYQKIIESIRFFRAVLELKMASALEDFDEVAVDINAKIEQACTDAVQDEY